MRKLGLSFLVVVAVAGSVSSGTFAATPTPPALERLAGDYRYAGNWERDLALIEKSVERATSNLGWLGRKIADSRLSSHRDRPSDLSIARAGHDVSITMGEYKAIAPLDGSPRDVIAPNGRDSKLSYKMTDDMILQYFSGEHAKRKSTYRMNDRGQLIMTVYMTSEKLAAPIAYELVYDSSK